MTGVPVVVEGLADAVQDSIFVLLGAALLVMAATLALVFRTRLRLLPLALALAAAAHDLRRAVAGGRQPDDGLDRGAARADRPGGGLRDPVPGPLRRGRATARGATPGGGRGRGGRGAGGPTIVTAGLATAVGFLVLLLSPVPMVRGFGALLVLGIALALACALCAGFAALVRFGGAAEPRRCRRRLPRAARAARGGRRPPARGRRPRVARRPRRGGALGVALARPRPRAGGRAGRARVAGLALDTQSEVVSDVRELVPRDLQALEDVNELQEETGVSGEIDVTVRADDITDPTVIAWMTRFQSGVLRAHGYRPGKRCTPGRATRRSCARRSRCPTCSARRAPSQEQVRALLDAVPPYFSQGVVTRDRKTANLAFGIRLMPLDRQKEVVDDIKRAARPARRASRRPWSACRCWPPRRTARSSSPLAPRR